MFTDKLGLSLDGGLPNGSAEQRASLQDQTLTLSGMTWENYEQLTQDNRSSYRISYFNRVITLRFTF